MKRFFHLPVGGLLSPSKRVGSWTIPCSIAVVWFSLAVARGQESPDAEAADAAAYAKAAASVETDLETEIQALAELRRQIAAEKPPLARETNEIAAEYREKTRLAELARQERDALLHDLNTVSNRVRLWRDEAAYIDGLLTEFRKEHEGRVGLVAAPSLTEAFLAAEGDGEAGMTAKLDILESALGRIADAGDLPALASEALGEDGVARAGEFIAAGPVSWFVAEDDGLAGLVTDGVGPRPEVVPGTGSAAEIRKIVAGKGGSLRMDPTLGTALALGEAEDSLVDHIRQGGLWIYPILALALIATLAALGKWAQLLRIRELNPGVVREVLGAVNGGRPEAASKVVAELRHPARALLERGIETRDRSREEVEEAIYEKYLAAQPALQRGLSLIAIASATAPLLGLLGTVTGMIHTFKLINIFGTGDAKSLASGISEALVTTEFGLVVAIPALILHALLSRKVQGIRATMEMTSLAFVNGLETPREPLTAKS